MRRRGLPTCWGISPAGRRDVQSIWQRHLLQSWWSSPHYDVTEIRAATHTHLRMMQKYFMIQRMCSRVIAKNVSTVKRLRAGQDASVEQIVAISVALHLPPPVSGDLLRMCGITLDFNNQKNTVYQMILTEYYKEGIEQVNVCLAACGCAPLKTAC